jgi:serine/threonine protein kinase/beta-lactam-binding protein with PASTA domain
MGDPIVGRVLEGRYRVVQRIARGGMSTVYSAVDQRLEREVAVKVMSASLSSDPAFADRFAREARVAAKLSHPNAVSVYDQGTDGRDVFLVMELVRGRTLRDLIRERGALHPALAVSIMEPVLGALAAAHRAGLVHRDVKPENILLSDDGAVKVADFGLARAVEADATSTRTGLMMGTVAYCPPEQISRGTADARSDVYAAGIVLFELLTGSAPYVGDSAMAVAYQHVNSDVPPPSSRRRGVPTALDEFVQRATRREPSARPLDAGAMLAELHDVRTDLGLPVQAVPRAEDPDPHRTQVINLDPAALAAAAGGVGAGQVGAGLTDARVADRPTAPTRPGQGGDSIQRTAISERPIPSKRPAKPAPGRGLNAAARAGKPPPPPAQVANALRRRRARRRTTLIVLVILLLGIATGFGAWWLTVGRYDQVPSVSGLSVFDASNQLKADGFKLVAARPSEFSETVGVGDVIRTNPGAHNRVLKGRAIELITSKGKERFTIPDLTGKTQSAAAALLAGIPVNISPPRNLADVTGKFDAGTIIRTDPPALTSVKRGSPLIEVVSTGPPKINVPNVLSQPKATATQTLMMAGFTPVILTAYSDTVAVDRVISTDPAPNTLLRKFSTINVTLSKGPEMVTIPTDIKKGDSPDDAKAELEGLGLHVDVRKRDKGLLDFSSYKVDSLHPAQGTSVKVGSTVILYAK